MDQSTLAFGLLVMALIVACVEIGILPKRYIMDVVLACLFNILQLSVRWAAFASFPNPWRLQSDVLCFLGVGNDKF
jgi:hypothetical protein